LRRDNIAIGILWHRSLSRERITLDPRFLTRFTSVQDPKAVNEREAAHRRRPGKSPPGRRVDQRRNIPSASALLCSSAEWGTLIEPRGGWDRIFPARGSREGGGGKARRRRGGEGKVRFLLGFWRGGEGRERARRVRSGGRGGLGWLSLPSRVYRGAAGAAAQLIRGFAHVHTLLRLRGW
jgi:hypothetical protein